MAIIGNLIKLAIDVKANLTPDSINAKEVQQEQLKSLLSKAKNTSFGKYYAFDHILNSTDPEKTFAEVVPIHHYDEIHDRWWSQQQKYPDITWPGKPDYFALSSGTTGDTSKRIPITQEMIQSVRSVGLDMIGYLPNYDLPAELFEKEILMLGSSADLDENEMGFLEGEVSGINVSQFPDWYDTFYRPGKEIASIDDWDKRVQRIAEEAKNWDIAAICGIPSWVLVMLKKVMEYHQAQSIHDVWPNLKIYASGGVAFGPYREQFEQISGSNMIYMDTYLASEGFFAYTAGTQNMNMKLAVKNGIYYEFIPFDERGFDEYGNLLDDPFVLTFDQIKEDEDYALLISTPAGAWRYMIGDTIKFSDVGSLEMTISGRTKFFLNVVGSQLSEDKINAAIQTLCEQSGIQIDEFCVSALKDDDGRHYHQWVLSSDDEGQEESMADSLDQILSDLNKNYAVARSKALSDIKVKCVQTSRFYEALSGDKEQGGQLKTPKVMPPEQMKELLSMLDKST